MLDIVGLLQFIHINYVEAEYMKMCMCARVGVYVRTNKSYVRSVSIDEQNDQS